MDALLDRLWELANEDDDPRSARRSERVAEARALWRALEVLLASLGPNELIVGDGPFTKMLACIRSVLSDLSYWVDADPATSSPSDDSFMTVFVCVNRVLLKIASRGEHEREALVRDGVADLIVRCSESHVPCSSVSAFGAAAALQTMELLAMDSKNRPSLQISFVIRACITLMNTHDSVLAVQLRGCQFLRQMALEEDCKERIGRNGGLQAITRALSRFGEEVEIVVTALDVLVSLCVELDCREDLVAVSLRSTNATVFQEVVRAVVDAMRILPTVDLVQAKAVTVLNSIATHSAVKKSLCSLNFWDVAENGLSTAATDEAAGAFVKLLDTLLHDPVTWESLQQMVAKNSPSSDQKVTKARLTGLRGQIEALQYSQIASKESGAYVTFVLGRLQCLLDDRVSKLSGNSSSLHKDQDRLVSTDRNSIDYDGYGQFMHINTHPTVSPQSPTHSDEGSDDELPVDPVRSLDYRSDQLGDDAIELLADDATGYFKKILQQSESSSPITVSSSLSSPTSTATALDHTHVDALCKRPNGANICEKVRLQGKWNQDTVTKKTTTTNKNAEEWQALYEASKLEEQDIQTSFRRPSTSDMEAENWQALYEASQRELQRVQLSFRELNDRYRIVLRRSKEQAKLLTLQNARITNHGKENEQMLRRIRTLEASLEEAERRCQVERALRSAEAVQCEQLSLALNDSVQEAKSLAAQQSSTARELQQKENMRTECMMRTRESKQDKQRVEIERDNALIQVHILELEKTEILQQLEACQREGRECLMMREEDMDARRPGVFSELAKIAGNKQTQAPRSKLSRRNSLPNDTLATHSSETISSDSPTSRLSNVFPLQTGIDEDLNDNPNSIETSEIQSCLVSVFELLDTSIEESSEGVHVSTIRRFFLESGLVQAPNLLPADVDVILAGVLAQAQANRKNSIVRKDFNDSQQRPGTPPTGWAKTKRTLSPSKSASIGNDVKRFRFFSQDSFNEAVTLVGMRKFPRSDLLRVLQTVVALYLRPYMRQRQIPMIHPAIQRSRSSSTCSLSRRPSTSVGSPSQVCTRAMKSILNGLALHLGPGNHDSYLRTSRDTNEGEVHCHLYPPSSNRSHKREEVVFSMLEMSGVLSREQRPLGTICEFYSAQHFPNASAATAISITKTELFGLSFELFLSFAIDFELIPSFMDRVSLKHLHTEVAALLKAYFALHDKDPPTGADAETLKKVAFGMVLARLALELFSTKPGYETPERQITGLLQWLDNSLGREKIMRKAGIPLVIRFSRQLYAGKKNN
ncbi:hypothetical protein P3T76_000462 [Phytophthora citrophthora]|uniref:Uncharacterized protein n=1 Tax=Phytophthora citrophthora TaxID=4793 RepID=A0AAD9LVC5_9STRA|nr:hypothetical protein P3T76_000462 [Phytophthora citrophthora]